MRIVDEDEEYYWIETESGVRLYDKKERQTKDIIEKIEHGKDQVHEFL